MSQQASKLVKEHVTNIGQQNQTWQWDANFSSNPIQKKAIVTHRKVHNSTNRACKFQHNLCFGVIAHWESLHTGNHDGVYMQNSHYMLLQTLHCILANISYHPAIIPQAPERVSTFSNTNTKLTHAMHCSLTSCPAHSFLNASSSLCALETICA